MLRWWEADSGKCVQVREAHQGTVQALKVGPDGSTLASCGDDGAIESGTSKAASICVRYDATDLTSGSISPG